MTNTSSSKSDRETFLKRIRTRETVQEYGNNQVIFAQGGIADSMFYIESGNVKQTVMSKGGKKAVISLLGQGDLFGEGCLAKDVRLSTATAIHQSTISQVSKSTLSRLIREDPAFAKVFISHLQSRIGRIEEDFVDQLLNSSEKRLARTLLLLASFDKSSKTGTATVMVSQGTLAEMVGTTRSRVSFFMNRFRKMGLIDYNGSLQVHRALLTFLSEA